MTRGVESAGTDLQSWCIWLQARHTNTFPVEWWEDNNKNVSILWDENCTYAPLYLCSESHWFLIGFCVTYMAPQTITNFLISCLLQYVTWGMISVSPWETDRPTLYPTLRPIHRPTPRSPRHDICHNRCNRRLRNFFADCVHFSGDNAN